VILIDRPERIDAFLTEISDLLEDVLVVLDDVEILTALVVDNEPPCPSP
jgi:PII-like signaling protein